MTRFHLEVRVKPRPGLLDPQGKATHHALAALGYDGVADVRIGKVMDLEVDAVDSAAALATVEEMGRKLLANPVTEDISIRLVGEMSPEEAEA